MSVNTGDILEIAEKHLGDPVVKYTVMLINMHLSEMRVKAKILQNLVDIVNNIRTPGTDYSLSHSDTVGNTYDKAQAIARELIGVLVVILRENHGEAIEY